MADPIIFAINDYIQSDTGLISIAGGVIPVRPLTGYEDDVSPIILYWWLPGVRNIETYWLNKDYIRYHILDTDAERGFKIQQKLREILNQADTIQPNLNTSEWAVFWMVQLASGTGAFNAGLGAPQEREGFYTLQLNFEVGYVALTEETIVGP